MLVSRERFEAMVLRAVNNLPAKFRTRLDNIEFIVEDYPDPDTLQLFRRGRAITLLGIYQGFPMSERGQWYGNVLPDRIIVYQGPIEDLCTREEEVEEVVRRVVLHEIGHFFGLSDTQLRQLHY